ncbi:MAG TPA: glycosyltransferase family 39 protein [Solirubrobacteraceae bacterium]|jgi:mannosyltransferase|nr:glycosyltransferase family 39 protein [Solirubrobacteraceae bacterium]
MSGSAADPVALGGGSEFAVGSAPRDRRIAALVSWWPLLAILLLAAALRLSTLGLQSFWYDEAFTPVHVLRAGLGATLHNLVHTENTPPLWYVLEWGFSRALGTGVVALRLLSALAGIATVAIAWAIGSELQGPPTRRAAIVTATLVAVNPLFVWYSQEARAYGLFVFAASLALLCFLRALREPSNRNLVELALSGSLALLTHYFAVFLVAPMGLWLIWRALRGGWGVENGMPRPRAGAMADLLRVLCSLALPAIVGLALIPLILAQGGHGTQWIGEWALASRLEAIPQYYLTGYSGSSLGHGIEALVALLILAGVLYGLWCTLTRREERGALIALSIAAAGVLTPVLLALLGADYLAPRNLVAAMVPLSALLAIVIAAQRTGRIGMALAGLLAFAFLALSVDVNLSPRLQRGDWSGVARVLRSAQPEHVITTVELGSAPLEYYLPRLKNLTAGQSVNVTEIDETGYAPLRPDAERAPVRGFHLTERRDINGLIVYRFTSSAPVTISQGTLLRAVIAEVGRPEALVPTASSGKTL